MLWFSGGGLMRTFERSSNDVPDARSLDLVVEDGRKKIWFGWLSGVQLEAFCSSVSA